MISIDKINLFENANMVFWYNILFDIILLINIDYDYDYNYIHFQIVINKTQ